VVRVCAHCKKSWSGGRDCPECGPGFPLFEAVDPRAREMLPAQGWAGIRALYGARRAMLISIVGTLVAVVCSAMVLRQSVAAPIPVDRWIYRGLSALILLGVAGAAVWRASRVARRSRKGYDLE